MCVHTACTHMPGGRLASFSLGACPHVRTYVRTCIDIVTLPGLAEIDVVLSSLVFVNNRSSLMCVCIYPFIHGVEGREGGLSLAWGADRLALANFQECSVHEHAHTQYTHTHIHIHIHTHVCVCVCVCVCAVLGNSVFFVLSCSVLLSLFFLKIVGSVGH